MQSVGESRGMGRDRVHSGNCGSRVAGVWLEETVR